MMASLAMAAPAVAPRPAAAESLAAVLTRKDEMNAVRASGRTYTLRDLIDRRALAPARFDFYHQRLGGALSLGIDGLEARRALAPARFDAFHPVLAYLMDDITGPAAAGGPIGTLGRPDAPPVIPPGGGPSQGPGMPTGGSPPPAVPEAPTPAPTPPGPPAPPIVPTGGPTPDAPGVPPTVTPPTPPIDVPPSPPGPPGPVVPPPGPGTPQTPQTPQTPSQVVPEPSALLQVGVGAIGLGAALAWRRRASGRRRATAG